MLLYVSLPGSLFELKFHGLHVMLKVGTSQLYVISSSERRKTRRICQVKARP